MSGSHGAAVPTEGPLVKHWQSETESAGPQHEPRNLRRRAFLRAAGTTKVAASQPSLFAATVPRRAAFVTVPNVSATGVTDTTFSMHIFAIAIG